MVCLLLLTTVVWSQEARRVLVVLPATGLSLDSPSVDSLVNRLKKGRLLTQTEPHTLPILRLDPTRKQHKLVLGKLGVSQSRQTRVLVCDRAESGWPESLVASFPESEKAKMIVRLARQRTRVKDQPENVKPPAEKTALKISEKSQATEVGLLLLHSPDESKDSVLVREFLSELGSHWLQRYGRIKPAPYPLAYYDLSQPDVVSRLKTFDQALVGATPRAALCLFQRGRPQRVLEVYSSLELPASLVRRVSSARARHLADTISLKVSQSASLPEPSTVRLTASQETSILLGRLHESAQQLWVGVSKDENPQNVTSRRLLLRVVELTRHDSKKWKPSERAELKLALDDFVEEPLILPEDSYLRAIQQRLLELASALPEPTI